MQPDRIASLAVHAFVRDYQCFEGLWRVMALSNVSFRVSDGEFVSIVGPNGAGKTTLVNVVTGLLQADDWGGPVPRQGYRGRRAGRTGASRNVTLISTGEHLPRAYGAGNAGGRRRVPPAPDRNPFRSLGRDDVLQADVERVADVLGLRAQARFGGLDAVAGRKEVARYRQRLCAQSDRYSVGRADQRRFNRRQALDHGGSGRRLRRPPASAPSSRSSTIWTWSSAIRIALSRCRKGRAGRYAARRLLRRSRDDFGRCRIPPENPEKGALMLNVSNLKVDIEGSRILNGISLSVAAGELVCLVGRNGAGKTTTFRSIMGYRRALSGDITLRRCRSDKTADVADRAVRHRLRTRRVGGLCRSDRGRKHRTLDLDAAVRPSGRRPYRRSLFGVSKAAAIFGARRRAALRRRAQDGVDRSRTDA